MAHTRQLVTTTDALRSVFFPSAEFFTRYLRTPPTLHQSKSNQRRSLVTAGGRTIATKRYFGPKVVHGPLINERIDARIVRLVSADGKLLPPQYTHEILAQMNYNTHFLQQVSPPTPYQSEKGSEPPICKIMDKAAEREAEKARKKLQKAAPGGAKQLELGWAIEKGDLEHRMKKLREFLEAGKRVDVVIAAKRKGRKASTEEAVALLAKLRGMVKGMEGGRESTAMTGIVGHMVTLVFEAKAIRRGKEAEKSNTVAERGGDTTVN